MQPVAGIAAPGLGQDAVQSAAYQMSPTSDLHPKVGPASPCQQVGSVVCLLTSLTPVLCCLQAFAPAFWAGEVLYDKDKAVFQALGNGKIRCSTSRRLSIAYRLSMLTGAWDSLRSALSALVDSA